MIVYKDMGITRKDNAEGLRTWIEIDRKAVTHNYNVFRSRIGKNCKLMAVVKSNAYGCGLWEFAQTLEKIGADLVRSRTQTQASATSNGVDWFGVDSITEALALRKKSITKPLLVLGYTMPSRFADAARNNVSLTISTFENLKALAVLRNTKPINIHIKIDTGMHRQGFLPNEAHKVIKFIKLKGKNIRIEGAYTHFAAAKNPAFPADTFKQIATFEQASRLFASAGLKFLRHAAATSGMLLHPQAYYDMVRIGIGLYGLWPSMEVQSAFSKAVHLKPVLSWKTIISEIKEIPAGERIGYDFTEKLTKRSHVAVCPVGYWHGYPRALSSIGYVLVKGRRARVLGRVSMDMLVVDVSGMPRVRIGDTVTLLGRDGNAEITADELAELSGTTNYEIVTRLNPLIKRVYV